MKFKPNKKQIKKIRERILTEYQKNLKSQLEEKYNIKITSRQAIEKLIPGTSSKKKPKVSEI